MWLVSGGKNAGQGGERRTDNVDATHQFIGTPVGIHFVHDYGEHLECLRQLARGNRESTLDIVKIQSIGLALFFRFVDQFLAHLRLGHGLCGGDDQISLAPRGHQAGLIAPVAVGLAEVLDGHTRH